MANKYKAVFPMPWGDMATRIYNTKGIAIREAKKHLNAFYNNCLCGNSYCEVYEVDDTTYKATKIFELDSICL